MSYGVAALDAVECVLLVGGTTVESAVKFSESMLAE